MTTYTMHIDYDTDPVNPRKEYDHLGTMVCWHQRYDLGDNHMSGNVGDYLSNVLTRYGLDYADYDTPFRPVTSGMKQMLHSDSGSYTYADFDADLCNDLPEAMDEAWARIHDSNAIIMLPLYFYDHGGITMRTTSFRDPWDSGCVGYIYVDVDAVKQEWKWYRLTQQRREHIESILQAEVEEYDAYLTGQVYYWYITDDKGETVDSCGGYYGYDYCEQEAQTTLATYA